MNLTKEAIRWMLKTYKGQPVKKSDVPFLVAAYKAGHRSAKKKPADKESEK